MGDCQNSDLSRTTFRDFHTSYPLNRGEWAWETTVDLAWRKKPTLQRYVCPCCHCPTPLFIFSASHNHF